MSCLVERYYDTSQTFISKLVSIQQLRQQRRLRKQQAQGSLASHITGFQPLNTWPDQVSRPCQEFFEQLPSTTDSQSESKVFLSRRRKIHLKCQEREEDLKRQEAPGIGNDF